MKIALIGAGGIAQKAYLPLLAIIPEVEIIGLFSRTQARVDETCKRWRIPNGTTELSDILAQKPQAALVITNVESHYAICRELLENNIDVYAEKPLSASSKLSFELAGIARENKRVLAVGFNRRYALLYKQAREILGDRKVKLAVIQKHRTQPSNPTIYDHYLDDTIHQVDLMRFYCGDAKASTSSFEKEKGLITSAVSTIRLPDGGQGVIMICNQAGAWQESVTIHAVGLTIHVDAFRRLRVLHEDHEEVFGTDRAGKWINSMKERGFFGELAHFFDCVHTRREPLTSAEEAARTQALLEDLVRASGDEIDQ